MAQVIVIYIWYIVSRFFSGLEDGGCSVTEIELARSNRNMLQQLDDKERRTKWHNNGFFKLIFVLAALSVAMVGFTWYCIPAFFSLASLQAIIFNPMVNITKSKAGYESGFFHLGDGSWDGFWKKLVGEKLYYFGSLILFLITTAIVLWHTLNL